MAGSDIETDSDSVLDALVAEEIRKHGNHSDWPSGDDNKPLRELASRLGVFTDNWLATWVLVGMELAKEQPEFNGGRKRPGRPRRVGPSVD